MRRPELYTRSNRSGEHSGRYVDHPFGDIGRAVGDSLQIVGYPDQVGRAADGARILDHVSKQLSEHLVVESVYFVIIDCDLPRGALSWFTSACKLLRSILVDISPIRGISIRGFNSGASPMRRLIFAMPSA